MRELPYNIFPEIEANEYDRRILYEVLCEKGEYTEESFYVGIKKLSEGEPLAYILGEWYFYGETFYIDRSCLIPRQDTEHIVDRLVELTPVGGSVLELCCGSGCIALSAMKHRNDIMTVMSDISAGAIAVSQKNAKRLRVAERCEFATADLFCLNLAGAILNGRKFDIIVSNPPYIRTEVISTLDEKVKREPIQALDGGTDGLTFYRFITEEYKKYLVNGGKIIYEIGYDQADDIKIIAATNGFRCTVYKDYGGNDRVAVLYN